MKQILITLFVGILSGIFAAEPVWEHRLEGDCLIVSMQVPEKMYFYKEQTAAVLYSADKQRIPAEKTPGSVPHKDSFSGKDVPVYPGPGKFYWHFLVKKSAYPLILKLEWQGCSEGSAKQPGTCFMPGSREITIGGPQSFSSVSTSSHTATGDQFPSYTIRRRASGYMNAGELLDFLQGKEKTSHFNFAGKSFLWILLLTLLGGIALNLTPCVLPMIPVNLAIIGADTGNRWSSVLRGSIYGAGMACAYGILGVIVVLTGSTFGAVDSFWWFNAAVALVFILLGLSLFDLFFLDLSRFRTKFGNFSKTKYAGVFLMGALTAVLAGACVAPVVAAALLQSGKMYNAGQHAGLFLPFVLGIGMALPWPLIAGGLAITPKPGRWMKHIKHLFGVLIILMGIYYAFIAGKSFFYASSETPDMASGIQVLRKALLQSAQSGQLVFVNFHADWCKNCIAMENSSFHDPEVKKEFENFICVRLDATDIHSPEIKEMLNRFQVNGLPACMILSGTKQ